MTEISRHCVRNVVTCDLNRTHFLVIMRMFGFKPVNKDMSQKNRALLGCYAANGGNFVPTFWDNIQDHLEGQLYACRKLCSSGSLRSE